jgi:hypothetical protein
MTAPFPHLCQPDQHKSCGACCGLYNYADSSRLSLEGRLRRRTDLFRRVVKGRDDLAAFTALIREGEDNHKRYEVIYCCEYLGFLGKSEERVGCLLHPAQNGGVDLRDVSFYGRELCNGHFCPSYHYISLAEKIALLGIIDDWYLYGLCVTDIDLVKAYFRLFSDRVGEMPGPGKFAKEPLRQAAHRFFSLKTDWPFRSASAHRFGKYYFDGSQYMITTIDYESFGCERSRFDAIFLCLSSEFHSARDVVQADEMIQGLIDASVCAYTDLP